jgi:hypothetical protein
VGGWEGIERYRDQFAKEARTEGGETIRIHKRDVAIEMLEQVNLRTPVNFGEARAGWHFSTGAPTGEDRQSEVPLDSLKVALEGDPYAPLYLQNYVEHMVVIDQGLYQHDTPPGGSEALHVPPNRRSTVAGRTLVVGGFHVSAPTGVAGVAADQVAADFGLTRTTEN